MSRPGYSASLRRQWSILLDLSLGDWITAKTLAGRYGVSKATVERDLATLGEVFTIEEKPLGKQARAFRAQWRTNLEPCA